MQPENQEPPNPELPVPGDDPAMTFNSVVVRNSENENQGLKASR